MISRCPRFVGTDALYPAPVFKNGKITVFERIVFAKQQIPKKEPVHTNRNAQILSGFCVRQDKFLRRGPNAALTQKVRGDNIIKA